MNSKLDPRILLVVILVELRRLKRINKKEWDKYDREVWGKESAWVWLTKYK